MLRFNNKGMALGSFIMCLAILIVAIIVVGIILPRLNRTSSAYFSDSVQATSKYRNYEEKAEKAAKKYVGNNNIASEGGEIILNISDLSISNSIKNECIGYVIVNVAWSPISSRAYLNCGAYITSGYN